MQDLKALILNVSENLLEISVKNPKPLGTVEVGGAGARAGGGCRGESCFLSSTEGPSQKLLQ